MKCPYCASELESGAITCPTCHAMRVVRRTSLGVIVGWVGIVMTALVAMVWVPLPLMLLAGLDLKSVPWTVAAMLIAATAVAVGSLWYSRSTKHLEWIRHTD